MKHSTNCDSYRLSIQIFKVQLWILLVLHKLLLIWVQIALLSEK